MMHLTFLQDEPDDGDELVDRDRWRSRKSGAPVRRDRALQEFREMMHSRFLAGQDSSFNYELVNRYFTFKHAHLAYIIC